MIRNTTEVGQNLFVIDIIHLPINIEKLIPYSEINFFVVLFSVTLFVHYHMILNKTVDLTPRLCFFRRCSRAS